MTDQDAEQVKGRRITGDARREATQQVREKYEAGRSIRQIADEMGRSYGWVHRIVSESGTALRSRGGAHGPRRATAA